MGVLEMWSHSHISVNCKREIYTAHTRTTLFPLLQHFWSWVAMGGCRHLGTEPRNLSPGLSPKAAVHNPWAMDQ